MKLNALTSAALIVALGLFTACGSEEAPKAGTDTATETAGDTTDTGATNGTDTNTTDNNTDMGGTDNNTDIGGDNANDASDCTQAGQGCFECFAQADMAGYQAYVGALVENCLCNNECQAECTDACVDPQQMTTGSDCETCFNGVAGDQQSGCVSGFMSECQADNTCITFATNVQGCPQ